MNEFHTKMIEREAKIIVSNMREGGIVITKKHYLAILGDLMEISQNELKEGRPPLAWLLQLKA